MTRRSKTKTTQFEKELKITRRKAKQGDADAQYRLGYLYDNGLGVEKDQGEAFYLYKLSAEQGHALAQDRLDVLIKAQWPFGGTAYFNGDGIEVYKEKEAMWACFSFSFDKKEKNNQEV